MAMRLEGGEGKDTGANEATERSDDLAGRRRSLSRGRGVSSRGGRSGGSRGLSAGSSDTTARKSGARSRGGALGLEGGESAVALDPEAAGLGDLTGGVGREGEDENVVVTGEEARDHARPSTSAGGD